MLWSINQHLVEKCNTALAGVAQQIEHQPVNQKVTGSIPSQSTCLGCGLGECERQPIDISLARQCFSPSPSSLPLSLKINKI